MLRHCRPAAAVAVVALLCLLASGCGSASRSPATTTGRVPGTENRLDLVAFPGYAEAGGDDPRVNWVTPFVQATGCKVHVRTVRSSTELLDAVAHGHYDGVAAFGDVIQVLTGGHEVVPLDTARIPNYASVYPALKRLPQNSENGKVIGVPHGRGADLLLWRTDRVRPAPPGWSVLFRSRYAGSIGLYDAAITLVDAALELKRTRPGLKIHDPYELDAGQFRAVVRLAARQSVSVGLYWQDLTNALAHYTGGDALVGEASPRLAMLLRGDEVPVRTAVPAGGTARSASWLLLAHGLHPGCMYRWLDYVISPKANAASARYLGEAPATPAACEYMNCPAVHAGDEARWARLSFWRTPQHDCHDARGEVCTDWFEWSDAWARIRSG